MNANFWKGKVLSDEEFKNVFQVNLNDPNTWNKSPLNHYILFLAIEKTREELLKKSDFYKNLYEDLVSRSDMSEEEVALALNSLIDFLNIDQLREKLKRELGDENPFELKRPRARENYFEAWYPMGTLVHVTPNNSPLLGVLGVLEGLLSGNINLLKLARKDGLFATLFFQELCKQDQAKILQDYVFIAKVSSADKLFLKKLLSVADVVSVWGGEESVQSIKEISPKSARIVEWGHKISFSYITHSQKEDRGVYQRLASEICLNEQLACSSPQCVYIEDASFDDLKKCSAFLEQALNDISPTVPRITPSVQEQAEITVTKEQLRLKSIMKEAQLIESSQGDWRIYLDNNSGLNSSPLYRTIWLKPLKRFQLVETLRPLKQYLQTAGVAAGVFELESLVQDLFMAGVQRVRVLGEMTDSYIGEPHDGVYALERYCQRINFKDSIDLNLMKNKMSFEDKIVKANLGSSPIMEKSDFQNQSVPKEYSDLFFYSGGSSGTPKLSIFTYEDYHRQMEVAAEGLFAAGLNPATDRCMNLFYAGSLYGGFTSFFTILEKLKAVQFPMGASTDFKMVGTTIVSNNVDTLLGMPSYLIQLFNENSIEFKKYKGIKKIFFGGEHFSEAQRNYLKRDFGVEIIRSASYGSVDAGPLGYQCEFSASGVHHLNEKLHDLEVVELESDRPVQNGEVGRFLFTSKVRHGQKIKRYAIGDVGRLISGTCQCGRQGVRFELMGRYGDVFRIGTVFLSYQKFQKILIDKFNYEGSIQIHLRPGDGVKKELVHLMIEELAQNSFSSSKNNQELRTIVLNLYDDLRLVVEDDLVLDFTVEICKRESLFFSPSTGKLRSVIDHRSSK